MNLDRKDYLDSLSITSPPKFFFFGRREYVIILGIGVDELEILISLFRFRLKLDIFCVELTRFPKY